MKIAQHRWTPTTSWTPPFAGSSAPRAGLVLMFGGTAALKDPALFAQVQRAYPGAYLFGCSTAGEIHGTQVLVDAVVVTAASFASSEVRGARVRLADVPHGAAAGERLARALPAKGLVHVVALSDGLGVNGNDLVRGLTEHLPDGVSVTGALAGDGTRFQETLVIAGAAPEPGVVGVLGFYGSRLRVGYGSLGGFDPFGPERLVTRSVGTVLYELDGQPALQLYKRYLGEHAAGLPGTAFQFPLKLRTGQGDAGVVRTVLAINEQDQSLTFAGDLPEGSYVELTRTNFEHLIDGAVGAAQKSYEPLGAPPELALLFTCVGRKIVLGQRTEEEVEGVREVLGEGAALTGFYSYGELAPFKTGERCQLHNQTMSVTAFREV
jgi:hypothetical protein